MKVKGRKANGNDWRLAIEKPPPYTQEVQSVLDIHQQAGTAIITAGTYRNFFEDKGQSYSHILNPKTGRPVTQQLLSVTVLHDDPTWADAWDTALLCLSGEQARKIMETEHLKALMISRNGDALQATASKLPASFHPAFMLRHRIILRKELQATVCNTDAFVIPCQF